MPQPNWKRIVHRSTMPISFARRNAAMKLPTRKPSARPIAGSLQKTTTGIKGIDEVTQGGLPKGRTSLICGTAGCGKTLFGMEFIVRGATEFNEPGVFMAF